MVCHRPAKFGTNDFSLSRDLARSRAHRVK